MSQTSVFLLADIICLFPHQHSLFFLLCSVPNPVLCFMLVLCISSISGHLHTKVTSFVSWHQIPHASLTLLFLFWLHLGCQKYKLGGGSGEIIPMQMTLTDLKAAGLLSQLDPRAVCNWSSIFWVQ